MTPAVEKLLGPEPSFASCEYTIAVDLTVYNKVTRHSHIERIIVGGQSWAMYKLMAGIKLLSEEPELEQVYAHRRETSET